MFPKRTCSLSGAQLARLKSEGSTIRGGGGIHSLVSAFSRIVFLSEGTRCIYLGGCFRLVRCKWSRNKNTVTKRNRFHRSFWEWGCLLGHSWLKGNTSSPGKVPFFTKWLRRHRPNLGLRKEKRTKFWKSRRVTNIARPFFFFLFRKSTVCVFWSAFHI